MAKPKRLRLVADYHQIHVRDDGASADLSEAWTAQATEDRIATADGSLGIGTQHDGPVSVSVELAEREPAVDDSWDHVTEASLKVASGNVALLGCTEYLPDADRIPIAPGVWRARIHHRGLGSKPGKQSMHIVLWPAGVEAMDAEPVVHVRWAPPPPPPPKRAKPAASSSIKTVKRAAAEARHGRIDAAVAALQWLAGASNAEASASLAEIHAFRGEWQAFVPHALALLAQPTVVLIGNVFTDMTRLVRRAARELSDPGLVSRAASVVPGTHASMRDATLLQEVQLPSERVVAANADERVAYQAAVDKARTGKQFAGHPDKLRAHLFALARVCRVDDDLLAQWDPTFSELGFADAVAAARWLAVRGRSDEAWAAIESRLPRWYPMAWCQLAPVELLVDPTLAPLMTPQRCAQVLATPRGPEAAAR